MSKVRARGKNMDDLIPGGLFIQLEFSFELT